MIAAFCSFMLGMLAMRVLTLNEPPRFVRFILAGGAFAFVLMMGFLTGCDNSPAQKKQRELEATRQRIILLQSEVDLATQASNLAQLRAHGCDQGAELYERMMHDGEFLTGSRQGNLCVSLANDAGGNEECEYFSTACEIALCNVEPHPGCTALWRAGDMSGYDRLKAPVPSSDRNVGG